MDAEEGAGMDIARRYHVKGYPSFILVDADGNELDRWMGYDDVPSLLETMDRALDDPMTVSDRLRRFRGEPTADDALKLGDIRYYSGYYGDAAAYYRRGAALGSGANWDQRLFDALADGAMVGGLYELGAVTEAADAAMKSPDREPGDMIRVARVMMRLGGDDADLFVPHLARAVEETDGIVGLENARARLLPAWAIHVKNDSNAAVAYKKATYDAGWTEDAGELNDFAWWCFENELNLDEAEKLARKAVELAEAGTERANILDTLAELCNLKGDCREAVALIRRAVDEAPANDYFKEQLARFEKILADQSREG